MTSPVLTERRWSGGYLVSEANGERSRDQVTLKQQAGGTILDAGTVLGQIGPSTGAPVSAANAGNTGNGVMGAVTEGAGALVGVYNLVSQAAAANAGVFDVFDPNGAFVGRAKSPCCSTRAACPSRSPTAAPTLWRVTSFTITVAANADAGKYTPVTSAATDGSQNAKAILFNSPFDVTAADTKQTVSARACEVNASELTGRPAPPPTRSPPGSSSSRRPASSPAKGPPTVLNQPGHTRRHCGG
jgi:hypothetical protein